MNGIDVIYWINLDRSQDRRQRMTQLFQDPAFNNVEIIRFSAIDNSVTNLETYIENKETPQTKVEYCCLLSHMECLRLFSQQSKHKTAMIMEDDATLDYKQYWKSSVSEVMKNAPIGWQCLMLSYMSNNIPSELYTYNRDDHWSCLSYIVPLNSAKKIIDDCYSSYSGKYTFDPSISHEADKYIFLKLITYVYRYPYFIYGYDETSTLDHHSAIRFHNSSRKRIDMFYENSSDYRGEEVKPFHKKINRFIALLLFLLVLLFIAVIYIINYDLPVKSARVGVSYLFKCSKCS